MFCHNTRLSFFACQKDSAGAALKKAAPALGSGSILKVRLQAAPAQQHWFIYRVQKVQFPAKIKLFWQTKILNRDPIQGFFIPVWNLNNFCYPCFTAESLNKWCLKEPTEQHRYLLKYLTSKNIPVM